jgi:asparagine synthase (glutamine-hydrolysing)
MCGILGGINIERGVLLNSLPLLRHRGPDEEGSFTFDNVNFLHARLSIQDLTFGHQPFNHNEFTIIYNGEIYNHLELRKKHNLICKTRSDTETLIQLYENFGINALQETDGMFAFAILDKKKRKLILARDRAGKKPLYYFCRNGKFVFGSELNALRIIDQFGINYENINQYLRFSCTGNSTPYEGIFELEAGSFLTVDITTLQLEHKRWWSILDYYHKPGKRSKNDTLEELGSLLDQSISSRLISSDLEVGAFLSGGIDSGLITAYASRHVSNLKTFTVAFEGQYDESGLAETVSKRYGTEHNMINISFTNLDTEIEKILFNYGEPFGDSSAIPSFFVSREAKKYVTVILNGDGADELFGGYRRYVPFARFDFFKSNRYLRSIPRKIASIMPFPDDKHNTYDYIYRLFELAGKTPLKCYLSSTVDTFEGYENVLTSSLCPFNELGKFIDLLNQQDLSGLQKIMITDFQFLLPNDLLVKMDIATMANSLEGRSPFLSRYLMEFAPSMDDKYKINGITTKYILRELANTHLPSEIVSQPKRGFEVPLRKWIESDLKEMINDYLTGKTFSEEFVDKKFILNLLENKAHVSPEKRAKMLWYMMALEIWHRKCYLNS